MMTFDFPSSWHTCQIYYTCTKIFIAPSIYTLHHLTILDQIEKIPKFEFTFEYPIFMTKLNVIRIF